MSKIIRLSVSNLLRIKAAEVRPDGALVVVAGRNDQGKSSLLNSIALALSGRDVPAQPIRQGAASGTVILETEEFVVTRRFSQTGGSSLEVRDKDGAKVTTPQAKLDSLVSRVTFDPFEFTRMKPADQLNTVRTIAGLDFTALDTEYRAKYDRRTELNRRVKEQEGKLTAIVRSGDAPAEEVSVSALAAQLREAQTHNADNASKREALGEMNDDIDLHADRVRRAEAEVHRIEQMLSEAKANVERERGLHTEQIAMRDRQKELVATLEDIDTDAILTQMQEAEATNAKVRANRQWNAEHQTLVDFQQQSDALTDRLKAIETEKQGTLGKAKFPVDGLGFSDTGVTFGGVPFEQAGTAVKIRVSVAIARSLNPALPVMLVRDGSLLDADSLALLAKEAEENGCQIWMEVVGDRDDATVVIEDGEVIATPAADKKKKGK